MYIPLLVSVLTSLVINYGEAVCSNEGKVCFYGGVTVTSRYTDYVTNTLGLAVEIISPSNWLLMTTEDFAKCNAIVFSDPTCSTSEQLLNTAESNSAVWSAAVDGNILLLGTDEDFHWTQGGLELIQNSLSYVTDNSKYCTSLYISFSCYYYNAHSVTVPLLDYFGTFIMSGQSGCPDAAHIIEDHPLIHNVHEITDNTLSDWGCSVHEVFDSFNSYPPEFTPLAIAIGQGDNEEFPDGTFGAAYILVNNPDQNNPCTPENRALGLYYFPSPSGCCNFIQCDAWGTSYDMQCSVGTYWDQNLLTCDHNVDQCTDNGCTFSPIAALQAHDNRLMQQHINIGDENKNFENKYNYYGSISLIGVIAFILINNIFIGCWCLRKNRNKAYVKCDMIGVNDEI